MQKRQNRQLPFTKILVATRGEIAVRVIKTIHKLGIKAIAVYTAEEAHAMHVQMADEAYRLEGTDSLAAFLDVEQIIRVALVSHSQAIHPGYGFLSENPIFADLCHKNKLIFIGPTAHQIALMGDKTAAIESAQKAGLPTIEGAVGSIDAILAKRDRLKYPLLVKPAYGGGGKGMVHVSDPSHLEMSLKKASQEALRYFSNDTILVEHYIRSPRHIEVQIIGDADGNILHLFERECSVQRRFQKIVEETPAPNLAQAKRDAIIADAVKLARYIGYINAGTVEFLLDKEGNHYFIEMNTRIQVEHPITEAVTGVDLVELQLEVAAGLPLRYRQEDITQNGCAIECRINAENPMDNFQPSPGDVFWLNNRDFQHLRIDTALKNHSKIVPSFDSLIAKVVTHQPTRNEAIAQMDTVLSQLAIKSKHNNIGYLRNVLKNSVFVKGEYSTTFCSDYSDVLLKEEELPPLPDSYFFVGWVLVRFRRFFMDRSENRAQPLSSVYMVWCESELGITPLSVTINDATSFSVKLPTGQRVAVSVKCYNDYSVGVSIDGVNATLFYLIVNDEVIISANKRFLHLHEAGRRSVPSEQKNNNNTDTDILSSPIPCKVVDVRVKEGVCVKRGDDLIVVEAMKMETTLKAWKDGCVKAVNVLPGMAVKANDTLLLLV